MHPAKNAESVPVLKLDFGRSSSGRVEFVSQFVSYPTGLLDKEFCQYGFIGARRSVKDDLPASRHRQAQRASFAA